MFLFSIWLENYLYAWWEFQKCLSCKNSKCHPNFSSDFKKDINYINNFFFINVKTYNNSSYKFNEIICVHKTKIISFVKCKRESTVCMFLYVSAYFILNCFCFVVLWLRTLVIKCCVHLPCFRAVIKLDLLWLLVAFWSLICERL